MIKNETKQDVFDDALTYVPVGNEYDPANDDESGDLRSLLSERYAAAISDDLPVIPKNVDYSIKKYKEWNCDLGIVFDDACSGNIWENGVGEWILEHSDVFARAWLDGYVVEVEK